LISEGRLLVFAEAQTKNPLGLAHDVEVMSSFEFAICVAPAIPDEANRHFFGPSNDTAIFAPVNAAMS
jgi:hypothetical protein